MINNANKEKWITEVLDSTHGMSPAIPAVGLFQKIAAELANPQLIKTRPLPVKQWAAAAIVLLALNIGSVVYFTSQHTKAAESAPVNPIAAAMQVESTYNY
jgi:hypothetical protein